MKKPDKNKIDQLFRDGLTDAESKHANFREEDWAAMEALMDDEKDRKRGIVWLYWLSGSVAALLLLFFGLNWLIGNGDKPDKPLVRITHPQNMPETKGLDDHHKAGYPAADNTTRLLSPLQAAANKQNVSKELSAGTVSRQQYPAALAYVADSLEISGVASLPLTTAGITHINAHPPIAALVNSGIMNKGGDVPPTRLPDSLAWLATAKNEEPPKLKGRVLLSAALLTAPDLNKAGSGGQNKLGGNAGFQVSAHVSGRWSVTTGASYAFKPYRIGPNQSNLLSQYFATASNSVANTLAVTNAGNPAISNAGKIQAAFRTLAVAKPATLSATTVANPLTGVTANCTVLDIPVNINYQVLGNSRRSLSAGAGLSSYFMLTEHYSFSYADNSVRELHIANQNQHILGVVNINTTYQQQVSSNLKLLVQPYIKLPITQIGQEQVNLQSTGVAVGFSWNLSSAKPK